MKRWTTAEVASLRARVGGPETAAQIGESLGRTERGVQRKAYYLGLRFGYKESSRLGGGSKGRRPVYLPDPAEIRAVCEAIRVERPRPRATLNLAEVQP